jgi:hypothetical protein
MLLLTFSKFIQIGQTYSTHGDRMCSKFHSESDMRDLFTYWWIILKWITRITSRVCGCGLDKADSGWDLMVGSYEHGKESSTSRKSKEFLDNLSISLSTKTLQHTVS